MRKIKAKERKLAGNIYCPYCKPAKVNAIYRIEGFGADHARDFACEKHKDKIVETDNGHLTEADYQTWMKL